MQFRLTFLLLCCIYANICTFTASAITVADAKANHVDTGQSITLTDVRITNLFDLIEVPFVLVNVEDDTGGIAVFMDSATPAADYSSYLPGDVFDIETQISVFFGLEEALDGSLGAPPAVFTPKNTYSAPKVTSVPLSTFPGINQQDAGTTPDDPTLEALESTQILFENVTIDQVRIHERDELNQLIDPPTIVTPDGSSFVFPTVTADDDFVTLRLSDGVLPEADRPIVRIRSSSAPMIGQLIPTGSVNIRAILYDVKRTDQIGEGRYRPYILDVESTIAGDVDYDSDVDSSDYATAVASFTQPAGLTSSTAPTGVQFAGDPITTPSWDDGNIDRDHDVDNTDLLTIIGAITNPVPSGTAGNYTLRYDPASGELFVDTAGGILTGYSLLGDSFANGSHSTLLSGTVTSDAVEISESELASLVSGSQLALGSILPSGLTEIQLATYFSSATYTAEPGTGVNTFSLALVSAGLAGDFNNDGMVDAADYTIWRDNLGANESGGVLNGNGNGGVVDQSDYILWRDNFGSSQLTAAIVQSVPETSASLLLLIGLFYQVSSKRS